MVPDPDCRLNVNYLRLMYYVVLGMVMIKEMTKLRDDIVMFLGLLRIRSRLTRPLRFLLRWVHLNFALRDMLLSCLVIWNLFLVLLTGMMRIVLILILNTCRSGDVSLTLRLLVMNMRRRVGLYLSRVLCVVFGRGNGRMCLLVVFTWMSLFCLWM